MSMCRGYPALKVGVILRQTSFLLVPALVFQWVPRFLRLSERLTQRQGSISLISIRVVRGVKDTGSVNVSGLSCAKVGVILRRTSFLLVPSSGFSMGSSLFTTVRTA